MQPNALQTKPYTALAPDSPAYADVIPPWLNYLVAAYPTAKLAANTFAVYEDAFSGEDLAIMRAVARAAVNDLRFFPTVNELRTYVQREQERGDAEQWQLPPIVYYRRMSQTWPVCPVCGERINPDWQSCPACADLAQMGAIQ